MYDVPTYSFSRLYLKIDNENHRITIKIYKFFCSFSLHTQKKIPTPSGERGLPEK
jgi:hypothetical protein